MSLPKNDIIEKLSIVILCAGEGTRLKKITKTIPKPLIKIERLKGISILQDTINNLLNLKVKKIAIVIGHLGHHIRDFITMLKENNHTLQDNLVIIDSGNQYKLGPLYSFLTITNHTNFFTKNNLFLIFPGDTIFDFNILKEIINIISENFALIHNFPFIFYRSIEVKSLKEIYDQNISISNAEIELTGSETKLKRIIQKNVEDIDSKEIVNQLIPIIALNYDIINEISKIDQNIPIKTLWETLNYMILAGKKVICFEVENKYNFYDIDSEYDFELQKKRRKGQ